MSKPSSNAADEAQQHEHDAALIRKLHTDRTGDAILILDTSAHILSVSKETEYLFGRSAEELVGCALETIITSARSVPLEQHLDHCIRGERVRNVAAQGRMPNRDVFPVVLTLSLLTAEDGRPTRIVTLVRDVGILRQQLAQEARLVTAGELAAGLAHELNQPLSAISHYCDAAMSIVTAAREVDEELLNTLQEASSQTQRAGEILRNLRDMIGNRQLEQSRENLNAIIEETTKFLLPELRINNVSVHLSLTPGMPRLKMIRVQIQQVIINLVLNSIEAMKAAASEPRRVSVVSAFDATEVKVSVVDTGPGIQPDMMGQLFDPFRTNREAGLGLGLPICQSIVSAHRGRIWSDPPDSAGATFHFALPRVQED